MKEFAYIHEEGTLPDLLVGIPFFEQFSVGHLNDILYSSYFLQCDSGDRIIEEGQDDKRIFVLLTGKLEVSKEGEQVALISANGEIFGEIAAVSGEKRTATVTALEPTLCLVIDQQFLHELKPEGTNASYYAAFYGFLSRVMAVRLQAASRRITELEHEIDTLQERLSPAQPGGDSLPQAKSAAKSAKKQPAKKSAAAARKPAGKTKAG